MANIIDELLGSRANGVVEQIGRQFGLDPSTASSALTALLPALAAGLKSNASSATGVESLMGALSKGNHSRYLDDLNTLGQAETTQDGNGILGHIFGSKEVSREVAARASAQSGVSADVLKKLLPIGAALLMGSLAKRQSGGGAQGAAGLGAAGGLLGALLGSGGLGGLGGVGGSGGSGGLGDLAGMLGKLGKR
jgi:hypothetical protein